MAGQIVPVQGMCVSKLKTVGGNRKKRVHQCDTVKLCYNGRKHAGSGRDLNLSVVSSIVCNVGTDKLVCNKRKSLLSESVLTILSCIEINRNLSGTRKKSVFSECLL